MTTKTANLSGEFEKKIMNLLKNKSSGFGRSGALSGGLLGAGGGAAVGIADAARKQMSGEMEGYSSDEILNNYLSRAGQFAGAGLGIGAGVGFRKGRVNRDLLTNQNAQKLSPYLKDQLSRGATEKELLNQIKGVGTHAAHGLEELQNKGIFSNLQKSVAEMSAPSRGLTTIDDLVARTGSTPESVLARAQRAAVQEAPLAKPDMVEEINKMTGGASLANNNKRKEKPGYFDDLLLRLGIKKKTEPFKLNPKQKGVPSGAAGRMSESPSVQEAIGKAEEQRAAASALAARRQEEAQVRAGIKVLSPEEKAVRDLEAKMIADPKNKQHLDDLAKAQIELTETQEAKRLAGLYDQTKDPQYAQQLSELNRSRLARSEAAAAEQKARADQTLAAQKAQNAADAAEQRASRAQSNSDQIENLSQKAKHTLALKLEKEMNKAIRKGDITTAQRLQRDLTQLTRGAGGQKKPRGKTGKKP